MKVISNLPAHLVSVCCFHCAFCFCFLKQLNTGNADRINNCNLFYVGSSWSGREYRHIGTNGARLDCRAGGWRYKPPVCSFPYSVCQNPDVFTAVPLRFRAPHHPHPAEQSSSALAPTTLCHFAQHPPATLPHHRAVAASTQESDFLTRRHHPLNSASSRIKCIFLCYKEL